MSDSPTPAHLEVLPEKRKLQLSPGAILGREDGDHTFPAEEAMSVRHVIFHQREDRWLIEDLNSTNGTLLNGVAIPAGEPIPLEDGDQLGLGALTVVFRLDPRASPEPRQGASALRQAPKFCPNERCPNFQKPAMRLFYRVISDAKDRSTASEANIRYRCNSCGTLFKSRDLNRIANKRTLDRQRAEEKAERGQADKKKKGKW